MSEEIKVPANNEAPANNNEGPVNSNDVPANNEMPVNETPAIVNEAPVNSNNAPVESKEVPANNETPVNEEPADTNQVPANITEFATGQLETKVAALESTKPEALSTYKEFWAAARHVNEMLRSAKFLNAEIIGAFRERIDAICERVKDMQDEKAALIDKVSKVKCNAIEHKIREAKDLIKTDNTKAQNLLKEALNYIKDDWGKTLASLNLTEDEAKVKMSKDDHDACWLMWKQVNEDSFVRYKEVKQNNYISISNELHALGETVEKGEPHDALEGIKEFQKKLKGLVLEKNDWEDIRATLNKYWKRADERFKTGKSQRNMHRIERRKEHDKRQEQWQVRQESNIQKFEDLISKNFDVITRIEQHIEKLEGDKAAARSDSFKVKVEGWIKEQQDKINDIVRANRELNDKIEDIKSKINGEEGEGSEEKVKVKVKEVHVPSKLLKGKKKKSKDAVDAAAPASAKEVDDATPSNEVKELTSEEIKKDEVSLEEIKDKEGETGGGD